MIIKTPKKIKRSEYEQLKSDYLTKSRSLRSLYVKYNRKNTIDKVLFMKLINKIRIEEGYPEYKPGRKSIKKYNRYSHLKKKAKRHVN